MQSNRAHRSQAPTTGQVAREIIKESGYLGMLSHTYKCQQLQFLVIRILIQNFV